MTLVAYPPNNLFDYTSVVDPTQTVNPLRIGAQWLNTVTGNVWTCTNNTKNLNVWVNASGVGIAEADPHWDKVEFLLSPTGVNGSTAFEDLSTAAKKTVTYSSGAAMQMDNRFGRSVIYFDGADDQLACSSSRLALGLNPFTIEFWMHAHNGGTAWSRCCELGLLNTAGSINIARNSTTWPYQLIVETYTTAYQRILTQVSTLKNYTWNHIAVQRIGSDVYQLWINGVLDTSATSALGQNLLGTTLYIGAASNLTLDYTGLMSDFRVTKGVARYSSTFTPPPIFRGVY